MAMFGVTYASSPYASSSDSLLSFNSTTTRTPSPLLGGACLSARHRGSPRGGKDRGSPRGGKGGGGKPRGGEGEKRGRGGRRKQGPTRARMEEGKDSGHTRNLVKRDGVDHAPEPPRIRRSKVLLDVEAIPYVVDSSDLETEAHLLWEKEAMKKKVLLPDAMGSTDCDLGTEVHLLWGKEIQQAVTELEAIMQARSKDIEKLEGRISEREMITKEIEQLSKFAEGGDRDAAIRCAELICELDAQDLQRDLMLFTEAIEIGTLSDVKSRARDVLKDYDKCVASLRGLHHAHNPADSVVDVKVPHEDAVRSAYEEFLAIDKVPTQSAKNLFADTCAKSLSELESLIAKKEAAA